MPDRIDDAVARLEETARALVAGRDVILFSFAVGGSGAYIDHLRELGAARVLVIADTEGTGDPLDPAVERIVVPAPARTMSDELIAEEIIVERMTAAHHAVVDAFDPKGLALVLGSAFTAAPVLGSRPIVGHRPTVWADLEDKATVDEILAAAEVPMPPHEVTSPADAARVAARLDAGSGVVIAAGGRNGGAEFVRWAASAADAGRRAAEVVAHPPAGARGPGLGLVRVSRFVEGIPASIGGFVTDDRVAVMRPVEILTLRRDGQPFYCGVSSLYDPPAAVRDAMRAAARRVGEELRHRVDLRGGFSVDGIVGEDGWVATEVNVRLSGSFAATAGAAAPISGRIVHAALRSGDPALSVSAEVIEAALLPVAEANRVLRVSRVLPVCPEVPRDIAIDVDGRQAVVAPAGESGCGTMRLGESSVGGLVAGEVLATGGADVPIGPSGAPLAVSMLDLADELWATGTGGLVPAIDVVAADGAGQAVARERAPQPEVSGFSNST